MNPLRILVVDDDPSVRRVLQRALKLGGHTTLLAATGDAACELLVTEEVDLILMDLRMPSMSGQTLYHVIASQWPHLAGRVVVMSGDPDAEDHEDWLTLHRLPVIPKPFELATLLSLIERLVSDVQRRANGA